MVFRRSIALAAAGLAAVLLFHVGQRCTGQQYDRSMDRNWATFLPPWPAYRAVMWLATALDRARDALVPPQIRMMEVSTAFARSQVIHVLAALRIPDLLADGPMTAEQLAGPAGVASAAALWRVLRLAVAQGVLAGSAGTGNVVRFSNTAISATLRADHPSTVRDFIIFQGQEMMPAWGSLLQGLRSGNVPWAEAHPAEAAAGRDFWGYLEAHPDVERLFSGAMANADNLGVEAMLTDFAWRRFNRFIDVGGSSGSFLAALLERHPNSSGVIFDLPQVAKHADAVWRQKRAALLSRVHFVGGSFLETGSIPAAHGSGDVYVMRTILHDWSDERATEILRNTRAAIGTSNATLALLELAPADGLRERFEGFVYMDVQMLTVCDGMERGGAQWQKLFAASGFWLTRVWPTRGMLKVVEAAAI